MKFTKKLRLKKVKFSKESNPQPKPGLFQRLPLSRQLYLGVLIIAVISVSLTTYFVGVFYWSTYIKQLNENQSLKLSLAANDLNGWINSHLEAIRLNARLSSEKHDNIEEQIAMSNALMKKYVAFHRISAYTPDRRLLYSVRQYDQDTLRTDLNNIGFENAINNKEEYIDRVLFGSNNPMLTVYIPVLNDTGVTIMVLSALINLRYMAYSINSIQLEQYGYAFVIDERNNILSSNFGASGYAISERFRHDYFFYLNNFSPQKYRGIDAKRMISSFRDIKAPQWFLVIEYPVSMIIKKIKMNLFYMLIYLIASLSLGI
ncbi:MAG: cache domain-containing protein, partial [Candidatus Cloacimonadaceae bacterium]|nr:cache domain-containing protein [Candidatus Cloacimonadaceae bacterium]